MEVLKGNRINACLNERNMTRAELIELTEIDPSHLSKIINGKKQNLNITTAMKIARVLEYPVEVVFIF
jgi:transcriptional regulator with XRE-family HTH domain